MRSNIHSIAAAILVLVAPRISWAQERQLPPARSGTARAPLQIAVDPNAPQQPVRAEPKQIAVGEPCRPETGCSGYVVAALDLHMVGINTGGERINDEVAGFTERAEIVMTRDKLAAEALYDVILGGGSSGFDVRGGLQFGFGTRVDVAPGQGVYARGGARLFGMKNNHLGFGDVSLPRVDIGYQYMRRDTLAELGGDVALTMTSELAMGEAVPWGVHKAGEKEASDFVRNSSSFRPSWGAHMVWRNSFLGLRAHFMRIEAGSEGPGPLDTLQSMLCGYPTILAVCSDVRYFRARAIESGGDQEVTARAWMVGLTVGAGLVPQ